VKGLHSTVVGIALLVFLVPGAVRATRARAAQEQAPATAVALFCAYGSVSPIPVPTPAGFEAEFAVTVVEITSSAAMTNVPVTDFGLLDQHGRTTAMKRVVQVDVFEPKPYTERPYHEGIMAYYLNPGPENGTHVWDRTLPAGTVRLRIRVALKKAPVEPERFRLRLGPYVIEGRIDGAWPTT
jgi:hypothetical protein